MSVLTSVKYSFTLSDLKKAIPEECFEISTFKSLTFLFMDFSLIFLCIYFSMVIYQLDHKFQLVAWPVYWVAQSIFMTGLWMIGHECGHGSFSRNRTLNDSVGFIVHSILLVPYHSWRVSHRTHHKYNSNLDRDSVYLPKTRQQYEKEERYFPNRILKTAVGLVSMILFGWYFYVLFNVRGNRNCKGASHFNINSRLFEKRDKRLIFYSNIGILLVLSVLFSALSFDHLVLHYFAPIFIVNCWIVTITFLHHTDSEIPYYKNEEWSYLRGALSTVDRNYGILNFFFHNISNTHVCHHLFPQIPHYNAVKATKHLRKELGVHYKYENRPIFRSLWEVGSKCLFVSERKKIFFYERK